MLPRTAWIKLKIGKLSDGQRLPGIGLASLTTGAPWLHRGHMAAFAKRKETDGCRESVLLTEALCLHKPQREK